MRNSEIIICKNIQIDENYENVLSYSESEMVNLCRNNAVYTAKNMSILGAKEKIIDLEIPYGTIMYANYMAYKNPNYGDKWIFAFITDVKYLSDKACRLYYNIDVWSTWYSKFQVGKAFIEREHVANDTIGLHTIPEGLEIGDYVVDSTIKQLGLGNNSGYYILASTFVPYLDANDELIISTSGGNRYNGIYSGLEYSAFSNSTAGVTRLNKVINAYAKAGRSADINCIFMAPTLLLSEIDFEEIGVWGVVKQSSESFTYAWESYDTEIIYKPTSLDTYVPVNNKLLTFPYCYLLMNNGNGGNAIYKYELFKNNTNYCDFSIAYSITPGMSTILRPHQYESSANFNHKADLIGGKYPTCNWLNDTYTNWLTQNALNIKLGIVGNMAETTLGIMTTPVSPMQGINYMSSGIGGIFNSMKEVYLKREFTSPQSEGNINCGDVNFSEGNTTFTAYKISIKSEYAKCIDSYFSRFGYKINEVKRPNLKSRVNFNYIKVGGNDEIIHGEIPATALKEINNIFRKGVTIFHNYENFGNYTISNQIRT